MVVTRRHVQVVVYVMCMLSLLSSSAREACAVISLFNDCFGPNNVEVSVKHPSSGKVLYQGTPPVGYLFSVDILDAQIVECVFAIPSDKLRVTTALEDGSNVLMQDYLVLKGHQHRIGMIGYLTDRKGTITNMLFQL
jgi:hypothetical protein